VNPAASTTSPSGDRDAVTLTMRGAPASVIFRLAVFPRAPTSRVISPAMVPVWRSINVPVSPAGMVKRAFREPLANSRAGSSAPETVNARQLRCIQSDESADGHKNRGLGKPVLRIDGLDIETETARLPWDATHDPTPCQRDALWQYASRD